MKKYKNSEEIIAEINRLLVELAGRRVKSENAAGKTKKQHVSVGRHSGPAGGIRLLLENGFFKEPKTASEVIAQLHQDGYRYEPKFIAVYLLRFVRQRILSRLPVKNKKRNEKWEYAERK